MRILGSRTAVGNYRLRRNIVGMGNCEPPPPHARCFRGSGPRRRRSAGSWAASAAERGEEVAALVGRSTVGSNHNRRPSGSDATMGTSPYFRDGLAQARARVVREGHSCRWMK
jgi:hypothetical protein